MIAFVGSAPFLQSSFLSSGVEGLRVENLMSEADPNEALNYYRDVEEHTMFCTHSEIEGNVRITNDFPPDLGQCNPQTDLETVTLSLLTRNGSIGKNPGSIGDNARDGIQMKHISLYREKLPRKDSFLLTDNSSQSKRMIIKV